MDKQAFLAGLEERLRGLPPEDAAERLAFYAEMIDDRVEDGLAEEAAVAELGPIEAIVSQILSETPLPVLVRERMKPTRRFRPWEIVLIILGFPLWFPLLTAAAVVLLAVYIVIWSLILALWAAEAGLIAGALGALAAGCILPLRGEGLQGLLMLSAGMALTGLAIFLFFGCRAATGGALSLTNKIALSVKALFLRKESA